MEAREKGMRYFAAGEHQLSAKLLLSILNQPLRSVIAIMRSSGPGVLRREPIPHREDRQVVVIGHVLKIWILAK